MFAENGTCVVCGEKGTVVLFCHEMQLCFGCFGDGMIWAAQKAKEHKWRVKMATDLLESTRPKEGK